MYPQEYLCREFESCSSVQVAEQLKLPLELAEYAMGVGKFDS